MPIIPSKIVITVPGIAVAIEPLSIEPTSITTAIIRIPIPIIVEIVASASIGNIINNTPINQVEKKMFTTV